MSLLEIKDIEIKYGKSKTPSVEHFSLSMEKGEIVSIVGESGSGKTTVIRAVLGLLPGGGRVEKGDIVFQGKSVLDLKKDQWKALRGSDISMIFQDSGAMINPIRRIGDQFVEYIRTHQKISKKEAWAKAEEMLSRMHLPNAENIMKEYPFQLSGGMRQRVGIAMAMTFQPKLLLADEPTSALDPELTGEVLKVLRDLADRKTTMIIVTHEMHFARDVADRILFMDGGVVVEEGPAKQLIDHPREERTRQFLAHYSE